MNQLSVVAILSYRSQDRLRECVEAMIVAARSQEYRLRILLPPPSDSELRSWLDSRSDTVEALEGFDIDQSVMTERVTALLDDDAVAALVFLDADAMSPEALIQLVEEVRSGADVVVASRPVVPQTQGRLRRLWWHLKQQATRILFLFPFPLYLRLPDPLSHTVGLRTGQNLEIGEVKRNAFGPANLLSLIGQAYDKGAKVRSVKGIASHEGRQAYSLRAMLPAAFRFRLSARGARRFLKFGTVGFVGFLVNSIALEVFSVTKAMAIVADAFSAAKDTPFLRIAASNAAWAAAASAELAIISNFILSNLWTFSHARIRGIGRLMIQFLKFNLASLGGAVIQFCVIGATTLLFGDTALVRQTALVGSIIFLIVPYNWTVYNLAIWVSPREESPRESTAESG